MSELNDSKLTAPDTETVVSHPLEGSLTIETPTAAALTTDTPIAAVEPKSWVKFEDETANGVATLEPSQSLHVDQPHRKDVPPVPKQPLPPLESTTAHPEQQSVTFEKQPIPSNRQITQSLPPPKAPPRKLTETNSAANGHHLAPELSRRSTPLQSVSLSDTNTSPAPILNRRSRQGFSNGDVIVTLLPVNDRCAWVSKAEFRPELVPEELMAEGLTLTVEDYVNALQVLVNDIRFNVYVVCYKRMLLVWIMLGFLVLLSLLFSGVRGLALFGGGIVWLIINAVGIFVCMWLKTKMNRMLERCLADVNSMLLKHRILLGMDDRGKISCQKVNLVFLFFDVNYCLKYLKDLIDNEERLSNLPANATEITARNHPPRINPARMDIDNSDIIITGREQRISQKDKTASKLLLRYSQRWVKEYVRKRLDLSIPIHPDISEEAGPPLPPRHCATARCPCQYIEEHLRFKPRSKCNVKGFFR